MSKKKMEVPGPQLVMFGTAFNAALRKREEGEQQIASLLFESGAMLVDIRMPAPYLEHVANACFTLSAEAQRQETGIVLPNGNKLEDIAAKQIAANKKVRGEG